MNSNTQESETYRNKIKTLMNENTSLGDEVRTAQENLRLSAGTVNKLNTELKIVCNENEELHRRVKDFEEKHKKGAENESRIAILSEEIERLNSVIEKKNN